MPEGVLITGVLLLVVIVLYTVTRPTFYQVKRSVLIHTKPEIVFNLINDIHCWEKWSPWLRKDPQMKFACKGADAGVGAIFEWRSKNPKIGKGRIEIIESNPHTKIKCDLHFVRPVHSWEIAKFEFKEKDEGTRLTWTMSGRNRLIFKILSMLFDVVDQLIGKEFEVGLQSIKELCEKQQKSSPTSMSADKP